MLLGDSQVVCKASTMGCMPTDPSGGYSGGVGTLGIHRNSILDTIWHRTYGPPGRGAGWVFGRLGPLAPRVLTATPGSFTCRDDHRIPTEASESAYPHAHGRGDVFATRWQPLANSRNASPGDRLGPSHIALATQKPAAIAGIGFADLTSGMDEHGAPSSGEPAFA